MVSRLSHPLNTLELTLVCAYHHSRPQEHVSIQHFSHPGYAHVISSYAPAALPFGGDEASADIFLADGDRPPREGQEPRGRTFHVTVSAFVQRAV